MKSLFILFLLSFNSFVFAISRSPAVEPLYERQLGEEAHIIDGNIPSYHFKKNVASPVETGASVPWGLIALILSLPLLSLLVLNKKTHSIISTHQNHQNQEKVKLTVIDGDGQNFSERTSHENPEELKKAS